MREMKDSGIPWIGMMPIGWGKTCLSYVSSSRSGGTPNRDNPLFWQGGTIPWMSSGEVNKEQVWETKEKITQLGSDNSSAKILHPNSVMVALNGQGKTKGMAAVLKIEATCNQSLCAIHCDDNTLYYQYLYYCFKSMYKYLRSQAGDDVRDGLAASFVIKQVVPIPPRNEQQIIANLLDRKCADIDSVLEKTKASIVEYKKLKQSVITKAVSKGVRGPRSVKDSGIEWTGEIPKEWKIARLKQVTTKIADGTHFSPDTTDEGYPYITAKDVHGMGIDYSNAEKISYENYLALVKSGCRPEINDVLLVKDGATTGRVGMVIEDTPCVLLSSVAMIQCNEHTDPFFLYYFMQSNIMQEQILISMAGSAMPRTTLTKIAEYYICLPERQEQSEIAEFLDIKCAEIDKLISSKETFITELESYKKSLIYEYVTGKKEVPSNQ